MEDYVKKQIDMIGQMLLALAKKLGLIDGNVADYTMQSVQDEFKQRLLNDAIDYLDSKGHFSLPLHSYLS